MTDTHTENPFGDFDEVPILLPGYEPFGSATQAANTPTSAAAMNNLADNRRLMQFILSSESAARLSETALEHSDTPLPLCPPLHQAARSARPYSSRNVPPTLPLFGMDRRSRAT